MAEEKFAPISAAELERMRDEIRLSFDHARAELDRIEGLLIAARAREAASNAGKGTAAAPAPPASAD